jgi:hypothetical protein
MGPEDAPAPERSEACLCGIKPCLHTGRFSCKQPGKQAGWLEYFLYFAIHPRYASLPTTTKGGTIWQEAEKRNNPKRETISEQSKPGSPAADASPASEAPAAERKAWTGRVGGGWTDAQAGVHVIEDHPNRRMTIKFDEKPSEAVRSVLKKEYSYQFDYEDQLWWKKVNFAKPRQARQEAEDAGFQVANMIRQEKGLEPKQSFNLGL